MRHEDFDEEIKTDFRSSRLITESGTKRFITNTKYPQTNDYLSSDEKMSSNVNYAYESSGGELDYSGKGNYRKYSSPNYKGKAAQIYVKDNYELNMEVEEVPIRGGGTRTLDIDEMNKIANTKMQSFINLSNLIYTTDEIISNNNTKLKRSFFNLIIESRIKFMKSVDQRAIRLLRFGFVKKLTYKFPTNKSMMFLRWKARTDYELQNRCIKTFAIQARINHAVAIYRLRWIFERDTRDRRAKMRKYRRVLKAFLHRADRIKNEIYSNRNQLQFGFRSLKNYYDWISKIELFSDILGDLFNQSRKVDDGLKRICDFGLRRKELLEKLIKNQGEKRRDALKYLKKNWFKNLRNEALGVLDGGNVQSEGESRDTDLEKRRILHEGLEKLRLILDSKIGNNNAGVINDLKYTIPGGEFLRQEKLKKLEKIAQNILQGNLRRLRDFNKLKKEIILRRIANLLDRKYKRELEDTLKSLNQNSKIQSRYKQISEFLHQFFETQNIKNKLIAIREIKDESREKNYCMKEGSILFANLENLFINRLKESFNNIKNHSKNSNKDELNEALAIGFLEGRQYQRSLRKFFKNWKGYHQRQMELRRRQKIALEALLEKQREKARNCLSRLVENYIKGTPINERNCSKIFLLNSKSRNTGLGELIKVSNSLIEYKENFDNLRGLSNLIIIFERMRAQRYELFFRKINSLHQYMNIKLYNKMFSRWRNSAYLKKAEEKLRNCNSIIMGIDKFENLYFKMNINYVRDGFYMMLLLYKMAKGFKSYKKGFGILDRFIDSHEFGYLQTAFYKLKTRYKFFSVKDSEAKSRVKGKSMIGAVNTDFIDEDRIRRRFIKGKNDFVFSSDEGNNGSAATTGINSYLVCGNAVGRARDATNSDGKGLKVSIRSNNNLPEEKEFVDSELVDVKNLHPELKVYPVMVSSIGGKKQMILHDENIGNKFSGDARNKGGLGGNSLTVQEFMKFYGNSGVNASSGGEIDGNGEIEGGGNRKSRQELYTKFVFSEPKTMILKDRRIFGDVRHGNYLQESIKRRRIRNNGEKDKEKATTGMSYQDLYRSQKQRAEGDRDISKGKGVNTSNNYEVLKIVESNPQNIKNEKGVFNRDSRKSRASQGRKSYKGKSRTPPRSGLTLEEVVGKGGGIGNTFLEGSVGGGEMKIGGGGEGGGNFGITVSNGGFAKGSITNIKGGGGIGYRSVGVGHLEEDRSRINFAIGGRSGIRNEGMDLDNSGIMKSSNNSNIFKTDAIPSSHLKIENLTGGYITSYNTTNNKREIPPTRIGIRNYSTGGNNTNSGIIGLESAMIKDNSNFLGGRGYSSGNTKVTGGPNFNIINEKGDESSGLYSSKITSDEFRSIPGGDSRFIRGVSFQRDGDMFEELKDGSDIKVVASGGMGRRDRNHGGSEIYKE